MAKVMTPDDHASMRCAQDAHAAYRLARHKYLFAKDHYKRAEADWQARKRAIDERRRVLQLETANMIGG